MAQRKLMQGLVSRIAIGVFGLMTVAMILLAIFDDRGVLAIRGQRDRLEELNRDVEKASQENAGLERSSKGLRSDHDTIEKHAREHLGLVKRGEIVIQTPRDDSTPSK